MTTTKKKSAEGSKGGGPDAAAPRLSEAYLAAVRQFESALERVRQGDYAGAMAIFRALEAANRHETAMAGRARMYIAICERKLAAEPPRPTTAEGFYHLGVLLSNDGKYDEALAAFDRAIDMKPDGGFYYARAAVRGLQGKADLASADLRKAIAADGVFRFQASNDPDFTAVRDEAVFIDVIEPTPAGA